MSLQNTSRPRTTFQTRRLQPEQLYQYLSQQQQLANLNIPRQHPVPYQSDPTNGIDLDFDADRNCQSLSSSPISTQSLLSHYSGPPAAPLSTFDSIPTVADHRVTRDESLFDISQSNTSDLGEPWLTHPNLMQTETWLSNGQLTPRSAGRVSHQRESSLSSLGSTTGPASPYTQNTSNPLIAPDDIHGLPTTFGEFNNYQLAKSSFPVDTYSINFPSYPTTENTPIAYSNFASAPKRRNDRGLLQPETPIGQNSSRPLSVASTITAGDSPATPSGEPEDNGGQKPVVVVPKFERTITAAYEDELYKPDLITSTASGGQVPRSPHNGNDLFAQRLQAANLHLGFSPASAVSRERSPFRHDSPLAPAPMKAFSTMSSPQVRYPSAQQMREQSKAETDARALQQQMAHSTVGASTPQTISPHEAVLEFHHDPDVESNFPLFPQQNANGYNTGMNQKGLMGTHQFDPLNLDFNNYITTGLQAPQIPQQYPFVAQPRQQSNVPSLSTSSLGPSRMGSTETGTAESSHTSSPQRPAVTSADGGTYTCTYHGCTLRFETPALLQKHKREGHRQAHGINGTRRSDVGVTGMTQAGPHRCDRINPSTGKPCATIFSRPYDLTRHEDTIHNARKQKVRCDLCTDEKTFSRADALTRHFRVCHPDVEFPGKHRRRGGHSG